MHTTRVVARYAETERRRLRPHLCGASGDATCCERNTRINACRQTVNEAAELDSVGDACVALNLKTSVALLVRTVMAVYDDKNSHGQFLAAVKELESRIMDEMDARLYFCLDDDSVRYYDAKNAFGDDVAAAFPSATLDIEEAGNCLALNRYTACVLHLMRAMEPVVYAVAKSIGLTYEFKGWDAVIRKMRTELEKSYPDMDDAFRGKKEFYSNVLDRLLATKDALRNPRHACTNAL